MNGNFCSTAWDTSVTGWRAENRANRLLRSGLSDGANGLTFPRSNCSRKQSKKVERKKLHKRLAYLINTRVRLLAVQIRLSSPRAQTLAFSGEKLFHRLLTRRRPFNVGRAKRSSQKLKNDTRIHTLLDYLLKTNNCSWVLCIKHFDVGTSRTVRGRKIQGWGAGG